uniref:Uroplakin 3B n=1 Tax=Capra hircus TaxID=9925 RepID=A0A8C2S811_CAPHI
MSNPWGQQIQPLNPSDQLSGRRGRLGGAAGDARSGAPSQPRERSLWGSGCCGQTLGQTNGWTLVLPMGLGRGQSPLLMALLLLLACLQTGMSLERISYVPQLSSATLAGRLTQSTFTLEQPRGQFSHPSISDSDAIWLVVAHSNATQKFTAPQKVEDTPVPADFPQGGYYLTLRASRALYPGGPPSNQLRVLRVGNDTHCSPRTRGCNRPLPGPGPYRVKFLVMSDRGPMAETEWSSETRLQQGEGNRPAQEEEGTQRSESQRRGLPGEGPHCARWPQERDPGRSNRAYKSLEATVTAGWAGRQTPAPVLASRPALHQQGLDLHRDDEEAVVGQGRRHCCREQGRWGDQDHASPLSAPALGHTNLGNRLRDNGLGP